MSGAQIFCIGAIYQDVILSVDSYPEEDCKVRTQNVQKRVGGNSANTLCVLSQFCGTTNGKDLQFVGAFAGGKNDAHGRFESPLATYLTNHHISLTHSVARPNIPDDPTSYIIRTATSRTIISQNNVSELTADEFISSIGPTLEESKKEMMRWFHFEGRNVGEIRSMIEYLKGQRKERALDHLTISVEFEKPNREGLADLLPLADVCFFSRAFAEGTYAGLSVGEFLQQVRNQCSDSAILILTQGSTGAYIGTESGVKHIPSYPPPSGVIDTIGAGDTFMAGVIAGRAIGQLSDVEAVHVGSKIAGYKCGIEGIDNVVAGSGVNFVQR